jgi:hypothetical protein
MWDRRPREPTPGREGGDRFPASQESLTLVASLGSSQGQSFLLAIDHGRLLLRDIQLLLSLREFGARWKFTGCL